jgi:hypothetical protein
MLENKNVKENENVKNKNVKQERRNHGVAGP